MRIGFKPQRGKFTPQNHAHYRTFLNRFKPQRGKFTQRKDRFLLSILKRVSNPNGVNLHETRPNRGGYFQEFQTPTG